MSETIRRKRRRNCFQAPLRERERANGRQKNSDNQEIGRKEKKKAFFCFFHSTCVLVDDKRGRKRGGEEWRVVEAT